MSIDATTLARELRDNLGFRDGDLVNVHSSMKAIGPVEGGPAAVISALIESVGGRERGTVMMPCFTNPEPVLDLRAAPCRLGLIPETFRTFPGVRRSFHQTHSFAAIGRDAEELLAGHAATDALSPGCPLHELARRGGWILHIGCDFKSCTLVHVAEFLVPTPYAGKVFWPGYEISTRLIGFDGLEIMRPPRMNPGCSNAFSKVQNWLDERGLVGHGRIGQTDCLKARASDVLAAALFLLGQDDASLLCDNPGCAYCSQARPLLQAPHADPQESKLQT